jgi:hypothetical protein
VELVVGKFRTSNRRNKIKNAEENSSKNPENDHEACLNQYCKYCGAPILENKGSVEVKIPEIIKDDLGQPKIKA